MDELVAKVFVRVKATTRDAFDVEALTLASGAQPNDYGAQLRAALLKPTDWAIVDSAVHTAFSSGNTWAIRIVIECCDEGEARLTDAVNDALREVVTADWLAGTAWADTKAVSVLREASQEAGPLALGAANLLAWIESAEPGG